MSWDPPSGAPSRDAETTASGPSRMALADLIEGRGAALLDALQTHRPVLATMPTRPPPTALPWSTNVTGTPVHLAIKDQSATAVRSNFDPIAIS